MTCLEKLVIEALANAKANGYTFEGWTPEEIALDMIECCSDFENFYAADIIKAITSVQT